MDQEVAMKDGKKYILIADDDPQIRQVLRLLLSAEGYLVAEAEDGLQVTQMAREEIDLYILDVNMPGQSGILAAEQLRQRLDTPIIFLTAYSGESDKVMGFSVGADDYIVKPFSNAELMLRVRAILRRTAAPAAKAAPNCLVIRDVELDLDRQVAKKDGEQIPLTYTEFQLLKLLASHRGKIFSLENIYRSIWNDNAVGDDAIMVHIKNIRKKLGDNAKNPAYIKTAWGKGYYID